ncbi:hypothetical protein DL93DRAFT_2156437 [Clavulina sp. PMI_390]|nr:hypothetical protein DL93DRAFT_2156437 [Clavulina sp. PMI_390]
MARGESDVDSDWPQSALQQLMPLAESGNYHELWTIILKVCFPSHLGFTVISYHANCSFRHGEEQNYGESLPDHILAVIHNKHTRRPLLILTWMSEHPMLWYNSLYGGPRGGFCLYDTKSPHIVRLHANGTSLHRYAIKSCGKQLATRKTRMFSKYVDLPEYHVDDVDGTGKYELMAIDLFEPLGYSLLGSAVCEAYTLTRFSDPIPPIRDLLMDCVPVEGLPALETAHPQSSLHSRVSPSPALHNNPNRSSLPLDVCHEIAVYLDSQSLRHLSLVNRQLNPVANRRLWRKFNLSGADDVEFHDRCHSLARNPARSRLVQRLTVGPCVWSWGEDNLGAINSIWDRVDRLKELLLLHKPNSLHHAWSTKPSKGRDYQPILRSMRQNATHLQLRFFHCEAWLRPQSSLLEFLRTQQCLEELVGVDVFATRPISVDESFLPLLRVLVCRRIITATLLAPGRCLKLLSIKDKVGAVHELPSFVEALDACPGVLSEIHIHLDTQYLPGGQKASFARDELVERLIQRCTSVHTLALTGWVCQGRIMSIPMLFPRVTDFTFHSPAPCQDDCDKEHFARRIAGAGSYAWIWTRKSTSFEFTLRSAKGFPIELAKKLSSQRYDKYWLRR